MTPNSKKERFAELQSAVSPGPPHFARILDRGMKANRPLEWLEKASHQTPYLKKKLMSFRGLSPVDPFTLLRYGIGA